MKYYLVQGHLLGNGINSTWIVRGPVDSDGGYITYWEDISLETKGNWRKWSGGRGFIPPSHWNHAVEITEIESKVFIENLR